MDFLCSSMMEAVDRVVGARGEAVAKKPLTVWPVAGGNHSFQECGVQTVIVRPPPKSSRFKELPTFTLHKIFF